MTEAARSHWISYLTPCLNSLGYEMQHKNTAVPTSKYHCED